VARVCRQGAALRPGLGPGPGPGGRNINSAKQSHFGSLRRRTRTAAHSARERMALRGKDLRKPSASRRGWWCTYEQVPRGREPGCVGSTRSRALADIVDIVDKVLVAQAFESAREAGGDALRPGSAPRTVDHSGGGSYHESVAWHGSQPAGRNPAVSTASRRWRYAPEADSWGAI